MRETLLLFFKGVIIGIGKVVPGVSGSVLAISLGVYKKGVYALSHFRENVKENFIFLLKSGLGILVSITIGSGFILFLLEYHYFPIMLLFCGLIIGTIPSLKKDVSFKNVKNLTTFILSLFIGFLLSLLPISNVYIYKPGLSSFFFLLLTGFIEAATMIIPGISGTAILMLLGVYPLVLNTFSHLFSFKYLLYNIEILLPFGIGMILATMIVTKGMDHFLSKDKQKTYSCICGFSISSLLLLIKKMVSGTNIFSYSSVIFFFIGVIISLCLEKKSQI